MTRLPVVFDKVVQYVIHDASLYRFISDRAVEGSKPVQVDPKNTATPLTTLKEFLDHPFPDAQNKDLTVRQVAAGFVVLGLTSTIDDAQRCLLKAPGAADVVVTDTGKRTEPMRGLLTNTEIAKIIQS